MNQPTLENRATLYCEKHGIVESKTKGNSLIYYTSYPSEKTTYKIVVDLKLLKEKSRTALKKYYKKGELNMCL